MKIIQGDVILKKVERLPEEFKTVNGKILQQSGITGHHHYFLKDSKVSIFETKPTTSKTSTPDTGKYIVVDEDNTIMYHGIPSKEGVPVPNSFDHLPLSVPCGTYKVTIAREWNYDTEEVTRVVD